MGRGGGCGKILAAHWAVPATNLPIKPCLRSLPFLYLAVSCAPTWHGPVVHGVLCRKAENGKRVSQKKSFAPQQQEIGKYVSHLHEASLYEAPLSTQAPASASIFHIFHHIFPQPADTQTGTGTKQTV